MNAQHNTDNQADFPKYLAQFFLWVGGLLVLFGGVHFIAWFTDGMSDALADGVFNAGSGLAFLLCYYLLGKHHHYVFLVFTTQAVIAQLYSPVMGRGINIIAFLYSAAIFYFLYQIRKQGYFIRRTSPENNSPAETP